MFAKSTNLQLLLSCQGNILDKSKNQFTNSSPGTPNFIPGRAGLECLNFSGASSEIINLQSTSTPALGAYSGQPFSFCCWIYLDNIASAQGIISRDSGTAPLRNFVIIVQSYRIDFYIFDASNNYNEVVTVSGLPTLTWHHLTCTWNGNTSSAANQKIYINAKQRATTNTNNGLGTVGTSGVKTTLGQFANSYYFYGQMADIRFYNLELQPNNISRIMLNLDPL